MKKGKMRGSTLALLLVGVLAAGLAVTLGVVSYDDADELRVGWNTMRADGDDRSDRFGGMPYMRNQGSFSGRSGSWMSFAGRHGGAGSGLLALGVGLLAGTMHARRKLNPVVSEDAGQDNKVEE